MNQLTQVTKILSTIVSMFPYSVDPLRTKVDVLYFTGPANEELNEDAPPGLGYTEPDQGDALTAMGLFLLGMAYSNANRFPEQITRRLRAVAATLGSNPPDRRTVDAAIQACHWQTEDLPTIVDDALGYFICWTKDRVPNPEARLSDLMTMDQLQTTYQLSPAAVALLDQARLIYLHYHATSINFISQVLPALQEGGHTGNAYLAADIVAYGFIAERVSSAPFLGLRGQLPEAFQIRTMPKLVYCALLYYQSSLEDEDERRNFSEYKIADIKNHVQPKEAQAFIETLVGTLPRPSVTTIADLVAVLPLEKAHVLMAGKTAAFNSMILEILRTRHNPGAWAQEKIELEDAEALSKLVGEVKTLLLKRLEAKLDNETRIINTLTDAIEKRDAQRNSLTWGAQINDMINNLAPLEAQLSQVRTQGQKRIKADLVIKMKAISHAIDTRAINV
ncbi:hypothetical protein 1 [Solanum melongena rhabdo-like virus]|uniref:hypothetical protein 1 n=1 Tax=Solanum melongena rhabdo-like virus TaxID=2740120 RepID=UPI002481C6B7|nr:hypothetical protein 1 [Solanum melongena rhabdo-like virus]QKI29230.1 hypothetical protein 1 [Solanum melongena rhabdo-like virus]